MELHSKHVIVCDFTIYVRKEANERDIHEKKTKKEC